ncbi:hypothetical protein EDB85DRAFT_2282928 [Lactarius pseudohatsudake]|nr:hypothetical protein EDB85DRAFT_2282928 [Lactarius pseudohatsudake]
MCIECSVDGGTARYILRTTGNQKLGWMAIGFRRNIGDNSMVAVWPSRGANGEYNSVALLQRNALYEIMPTPDPHPPFAAKLSLTDTYVTVQNPQIAFTRRRDVEHHLGIQAPGSADSDAPISPHTTKLAMAQRDAHPYHPRRATSPSPLPQYIPGIPKAEDEGESDDDEGGSGSSASFVHGALCIVGSLLMLPSGALMARYANATRSALHSTARYSASAFITGGTLTHLFMDNHSSSMAPKVGGAGLMLLYVVQCAIWSWVHRIPEESRTDVHGALLAGLGDVIILLAFFKTWLGLISSRRSTHTVPSLYAIGMLTVQRRFGTVKADRKGRYGEAMHDPFRVVERVNLRYNGYLRAATQDILFCLSTSHNLSPKWQPKNRLSTTGLTSSALCGFSTNPSTRPTEHRPVEFTGSSGSALRAFVACWNGRALICYPPTRSPHQRRPSQPQLRRTWTLLLGSSDDESRAFLPPDRTASTTGARNTGNDAEFTFALLRYNTAPQKELAARCGGTRSTSLARWVRARGCCAPRRRWCGCGCTVTAGRHSERRV